MSDEILQLKPGIYGVSLDLKALVKRLRSGRQAPDPLAAVAERFLRVFLEHGVAVPQIPRLVADLPLSALRDVDTLIEALNPLVLETVAAMFGIRREWLEGVTETIYPDRFVYKHLPAFLELLPIEDSKPEGIQAMALASVELDFRKSQEQPVALILREHVAVLGEQLVPRFIVLNDAWDWSYAPTRFQLKAMARICYERFGPVPIHRLTKPRLEAIRSGKAVPSDFVTASRITNPSLEDYVMAANESPVARETEELTDVLLYEVEILQER